MADELLDIVNDEDIVIDQQPRSTAHRLGLQHRGVHVFLFTRDGKMLVQKRSADRTYPSCWDCSVSEHVKDGESYLEAARRGMKEELGLDEIEIRPLVTFRMKYGPNDNEISTLYEGVVDPALVSFDPLEIEKIEYCNMEKLTQMMVGGEERLCGWFVEMLKWQRGETSAIQTLKVY